MLLDVRVLEIIWEGPFEVEKAVEQRKFHLYQLYGTHTVLGPETLLYIGMTGGSDLGRLRSHIKEWVGSEAARVTAYIGVLRALEQPDADCRQPSYKDIRDAEALLIYYASPPYNSKCIKEPGDTLALPTATLVLNLGKRNRLPLEVSTIWQKRETRRIKGALM